MQDASLSDVKGVLEQIHTTLATLVSTVQSTQSGGILSGGAGPQQQPFFQPSMDSSYLQRPYTGAEGLNQNLRSEIPMAPPMDSISMTQEQVQVQRPDIAAVFPNADQRVTDAAQSFSQQMVPVNISGGPYDYNVARVDLNGAYSVPTAEPQPIPERASLGDAAASAKETVSNSAAIAAAGAREVGGSFGEGIGAAASDVRGIVFAPAAAAMIAGEDTRRVGQMVSLGISQAGQEARSLVLLQGGGGREAVESLASYTRDFNAINSQGRFVSASEKTDIASSTLGAFNGAVGIGKFAASWGVTSALAGPSLGLSLVAGYAVDKVLDAAVSIPMKAINEGFVRGAATYSEASNAMKYATGSTTPAPPGEVVKLALYTDASKLIGKGLAAGQQFSYRMMGTSAEEVGQTMQQLGAEGRLDVGREGSGSSYKGLAERMKKRVINVLKDVDSATRLLDVSREEAQKIVQENERRGISTNTFTNSVLSASIGTGQSQSAIMQQVARNEAMLGSLGIAPGFMAVSLAEGAGLAGASTARGLGQYDLQRFGGRAGMAEATSQFAMGEIARNKNLDELALGAGASLSDMADWRTAQNASLKAMNSPGGYYQAVFKGSERMRDMSGDEMVQYQAQRFASVAGSTIAGLDKMDKEDFKASVAGYLMKTRGYNSTDAEKMALAVYDIKKNGSTDAAVTRGKAEAEKMYSNTESMVDKGLGAVTGAVKDSVVAGLKNAIPVYGQLQQLKAVAGGAGMLVKAYDEQLTSAYKKIYTDVSLANKTGVYVDENGKKVKESALLADVDTKQKAEREQRQKEKELRSVAAEAKLISKDKETYLKTKDGKVYQGLLRGTSNQDVDRKLKDIAATGDAQKFVDYVQNEGLGKKGKDLSSEERAAVAMLAGKYGVKMDKAGGMSDEEFKKKQEKEREKAKKMSALYQTNIFDEFGETGKKVKDAIRGSYIDRLQERMTGTSFSDMKVGDVVKNGTQSLQALGRVQTGFMSAIGMGPKAKTDYGSADFSKMSGKEVSEHMAERIEGAMKTMDPQAQMVELQKITNQTLAVIARKWI